MDSGRFQRSHNKITVALATAMIVLLAGVILADDYEDPLEPTPMGMPSVGFGGLTVETPDVTGFDIDAREAIEPQLTAWLIMGEVDDSPSGTVVVTMQPTFDIWTE